jgi:hypothetical protein
MFLTEFILPLVGMIVPISLYVIQPQNIAEIVPCFSLSDIIPVHSEYTRSLHRRQTSIFLSAHITTLVSSLNMTLHQLLRTVLVNF